MKTVKLPISFCDLGIPGVVTPEMLEVPVIPNLDAKILAKIEKNRARFDMQTWGVNEETGACRTTLCLGGWAIALGGDVAKRLVKKTNPGIAASMIYAASTGYIPDFYTNNGNALRQLRKRAEKSHA